MIFIESKPLTFSHKDIQDILRDKHQIFKRSNMFSWEYQDENPPAKNTSLSIPLSFYEVGNPFKLYNTECLVEGSDLSLRYFRVPTILKEEKKPLQEALEYVKTNLENPHKDVLLALLSRL